MKAPHLDYLRPADLAEALAELRRLGDDGRIIAGGQSLVPMLNMRLTQPGTLIDIARLEELRHIAVEGDRLAVGAAVTQQDVLDWPDLDRLVPLARLALDHVGHFQTRNRGTLAGSIAHADPSSEQPLLAATLGAEIELRSAGGTRRVKAADFFLGPLTTARRADELVARVLLPLRRPGQGFAFDEVARRAGDFAIVAVAAVADGATVRLGIGGVAGRPALHTLPAADRSGWEESLNQLAWSLEAGDDQHATARYRRELVRRVGRRVAEEALQCRS